MTDRPTRVPDLDSILGDDVSPQERARWERVHRDLVRAGPPPELSPRLRRASGEEEERVTPLYPRHRAAVAVVAAAAIGLTVFAAGFFVGAERTTEPDRTIQMTAPQGSGVTARASLAVFAVDAAGNWPMELTVSGLPPLPSGQTYELWLTKDGSLAEPCGTFGVEAEGTTVVSLNAPYRLSNFDGWVVTRTGSEEPLLTT